MKLLRGHCLGCDLCGGRWPTILLTDSQFPVRENTNLIHTAKKATDRNYLFMNNSQTTSRGCQTRQLRLSLLESFNSYFPTRTSDCLLLRYFLWISINTNSTIGLQSLLTVCNSTNLEAHVINILHTDQNTRPLLGLKPSQMFHPSRDIIINLPVIIKEKKLFEWHANVWVKIKAF